MRTVNHLSSYGRPFGGSADDIAAAQEELERLESSLGARPDSGIEREPLGDDEAPPRPEPACLDAEGAPSEFGTGADIGDDAIWDGELENTGAVQYAHIRLEDTEPATPKPSPKRRNELRYDDRPDDNPEGKYVCAFCGRKFDPGVNPDRLGGGFFTNTSRTYCSKRCKNDALMRRRAARPKERRLITCPTCGNPFEASRKNAVFCSNACRQKAYRLRKRTGGDANPAARNA